MRPSILTPASDARLRAVARQFLRHLGDPDEDGNRRCVEDDILEGIRQLSRAERDRLHRILIEMITSPPPPARP